CHFRITAHISLRIATQSTLNLAIVYFGHHTQPSSIIDTRTSKNYTLSLHDALPISRAACFRPKNRCASRGSSAPTWRYSSTSVRSEEHTSELQSRENLVCRLLLEKKKKKITMISLCYN